jgi:hypothetical protein
MLPILLVVFLASAPTFCQNNPGNPSPSATSTTDLPESATVPVAFDGGAMFGNARLEPRNLQVSPTYIIDGAVGFVLPKDNPGGVLSLKFTAPPAVSAEAEFKQFPRQINPQTSVLDGKPIEIQIAPSQIYFFMSLKQNAELALSEVKFTSGAALSEPGNCGCIQIKILSDIPNATINMKDLLKWKSKK